MKLRYLVKSKKITANDVHTFMNQYRCGAEEAKHKLRESYPKEKVLQYFDGETHRWFDVPTVYESTWITE